ncbi:hypothetical protein [Vineibacter terrae]|uniref:hypothetical protein n=1 Tax=Vineibacter terrae TaxID=2586908 RepID=UPI002E326BA1|nr:hypothetical protein [Vineibacter terrae]HEX2891849.1 hypothetical protein [Vineibacter terrae]
MPFAAGLEERGARAVAAARASGDAQALVQAYRRARWRQRNHHQAYKAAFDMVRARRPDLSESDIADMVMFVIAWASYEHADWFWRCIPTTDMASAMVDDGVDGRPG